MKSNLKLSTLRILCARQKQYGIRFYSIPGSGAGKGGGAGGSIKEAGGGLGQYGAAQEEGYFHNLAREQLKKLKQMLQSEESKPTKAQEEKKSE